MSVPILPTASIVEVKSEEVADTGESLLYTKYEGRRYIEFFQIDSDWDGTCSSHWFHALSYFKDCKVLNYELRLL